MRSYVQSKECKRKIIFNYFDHKVPDNQPQDHTYCDFHRLHYQCENCMLVHAAEQVEALSVQDESEMTLTEQNEGNSQLFTSEAKLKIKQDMEKYRLQLQKEMILGKALSAMWPCPVGLPLKWFLWSLNTCQTLSLYKRWNPSYKCTVKIWLQIFSVLFRKTFPRRHVQ